MGEHQRVLARQRAKLVRVADKAIPGQLRNIARGERGKAFGRVQTRTDRRAAQCQSGERGGGELDFFSRALQHAVPAADFLGKAQGRGVLQMRPPDFDHVLVFRLQAL